MLVMVVFFIAFSWLHLSPPLIRLFLLVLLLLLMPTLNFVAVWFALSLLRLRLFGRPGPLDQRLGARLVGIEQIESRPVAGDLARVCEAAKRIFRHGARHRQRALDQLGQHLRRAVARRDDRLLFADQHAQPE